MKEVTALKDRKLENKDKTTIAILEDVLKTYIAGAEFKELIIYKLMIKLKDKLI